MDHKSSPGWLALQATAIVGSILLAFAIDAWWDNRQERELEQAVLVSLHRDFLQSRVNLNEALPTVRYLEDALFSRSNPQLPPN